MNELVLHRKEIIKLERLRKRLAWLEKRIAATDLEGKDMAYDKQEASALRWAIYTIEDLTSPTKDRRIW